jgi:hypothetical protein
VRIGGEGGRSRGHEGRLTPLQSLRQPWENNVYVTGNCRAHSKRDRKIHPYHRSVTIPGVDCRITVSTGTVQGGGQAFKRGAKGNRFNRATIMSGFGKVQPDGSA